MNRKTVILTICIGLAVCGVALSFIGVVLVQVAHLRSGDDDSRRTQQACEEFRGIERDYAYGLLTNRDLHNRLRRVEQLAGDGADPAVTDAARATIDVWHADDEGELVIASAGRLIGWACAEAGY